MFSEHPSLVCAAIITAAGLAIPPMSDACTGITLHSADGATVPARTIEWSGDNIHSRYVVVPRGYEMQSYTPKGKTGMKFRSKYGYVGVATDLPEFIADGLNEKGLSVGLFYFQYYGGYKPYDETKNATSVADLQLVAYLLGECANLDDVREAMKHVNVIGLDPSAATLHWRFTEASGKQMILEIVDGELHFFDSKLGVLTNSPGYEWQITNLNNYVNLYPGGANPQKIGEMDLRAFGGGSGFRGLPGDFTPPSRFVRAAFFSQTARQQPTAGATVRQAFQILNNFDIPIGAQWPMDKAVPADLPSATQWTCASDVTNRRFYYRTMYNSAIRCFDVAAIDFATVKFQINPLDDVTEQPVYMVPVK